MKREKILDVKTLSKHFVHNGSKVRVFENMSFSAKKGEVIAFLGPSGCGKSTLLRCLAGLIPFNGTIDVAGKTPAASVAGKEIAFAFQEAGLIGWKNVFENIMLPSQIGKQTLSKPEAAQRAESLIRLVGLKEFRNFLPDELSGGMRQRAALARALLLTPKLLLLDEPFSALDSITRLKLMVEFKLILKAQQTTTVLITHNIQEAAYLADHIFILSNLPATIVDHVPVVYTQERTIDIMDTPEFVNISSECRKKIFDYAF